MSKAFHSLKLFRFSFCIQSALALVLLAIVTSWSASCFAEEDTEVNIPGQLTAFAHLSYYSDRGFMIGIFPASRANAAENLKFGEFPDDLAQYLEPRESNLLTTEPHAPWLQENEESPRDIESTLGRLSQFGLVELFHHQNSRLLDSPLETRPKLMGRLKIIADQIKVSYAGLIGEGLDRDDLIVLVANMRRLSVEFDMNILQTLSPEERSRVAKLVYVAMPVAIETIQRDTKRYGPFGFEVEKKKPGETP